MYKRSFMLLRENTSYKRPRRYRPRCATSSAQDMRNMYLVPSFHRAFRYHSLLDSHAVSFLNALPCAGPGAARPGDGSGSARSQAPRYWEAVQGLADICFTRHRPIHLFQASTHPVQSSFSRCRCEKIFLAAPPSTFPSPFVHLVITIARFCKANLSPCTPHTTTRLPRPSLLASSTKALAA
jgi:hypothetical protein